MAIGEEDSGMFLFDQDFTAESALITGFGLEMGLREFYLSMQKKVKAEGAKNLFGKLAEIEILHQKQLLGMYEEITGEHHDLEDFAGRIVEPAMEGGLTTEEYMSRYLVDFEVELEILSLALAIEAQALDLYLRAAEKSTSAAAKTALLKIAEEERNHITLLGDYVDKTQQAQGRS